MVLISEDDVQNEGFFDTLLDAPMRYGHFRYHEAVLNSLVCLSDPVWVKPAAAKAFMEMVSCMVKDGCQPVIAKNGFRSFDQQVGMFRKYCIDKSWGVNKTLKRVALPGFSEHHTGFAIDIRLPRAGNVGKQTRLSSSKSYKWLKEHARKFGFYETFGKNNVFGTVYEPWHWCFKGCDESFETFYRRELFLTAFKEGDRFSREIVCSASPFELNSDLIFDKFVDSLRKSFLS